MSKIVEFNSAAAMIRAQETNINYILPDKIGDGATSLLILLGFRNLAQIAEKPNGYFLSIHGFGQKTVDKLESVLNEHHLKFKPYPEYSGYAERVDAIMDSIKSDLDQRIAISKANAERHKKKPHKFKVISPEEP